MNIVFIILLVIAILIAFLLFLALVTKNAYHIERDIIINKPRKEVFDYLKIMQNQEAYSVWVMKDPTNKTTYTGIDGTVGALCAWEGEKQAGKGEQEIIKVEEGKSTDIEIRFERPFKNVGYTKMTTVDAGLNQTKVTWEMNGRNKYPMNLMNLVIDGLLGTDMAKSLGNVKTILEG
jgi:uncharacterized protein YndB with AHSA1/START domain